LKAFIELMVRAVVDLPDEVRVDEESGEVATTYHIHVAPTDLGKALGKQGRIANAMRVLAKASAMRDKRKVYLEVVSETPAPAE
jgi:uncharacterized protein